MTKPADDQAPIMTERHYQAMSTLALSVVILIQIQQQATFLAGVALFVNVLIALVGAMAIFYRSSLSPLVVLIAIAAPQIAETFDFHNLQFRGDRRSMQLLDVGEVVWCAAVLVYFIGQYRLQTLWFGILPDDARVTTPPGEDPGPPKVRSARSLRPTELAALVFAVPAVVFFAQIAVMVLKHPWTFVDLEDARWKQLFVVAWTLLVVMFLAAHVFSHWRRLQMDRGSALLTLQDTLWDETGGEQRDINRWIVWKKLTNQQLTKP
ncbi:MAG: hypothetical protein FJ303_03675 [Planctomycetes bacterium]|nr:hypothetical protein [Planctomycetota bacterium]